MNGWAVGIMTGTSADGIDVALVAIQENDSGWPTCRLADFRYQPFPEEWRTKIMALSRPTIPVRTLAAVHRELARIGAALVNDLVRAQGLAPASVRAIGFHGQTVAHYPDAGFSWQIGDTAYLAALTGIGVVSGFRASDMALGGQGAPLVPYFDYALFRHQDRTRVLLNIGGIANITVIPAGASPEQVTGFDTGPGNMVLDGVTAVLSGGQLSYDPDGAIAAKGQAATDLVERWMAHPYFHKPPPKSTGREEFGTATVNRLIRQMHHRRLSREDALRTVTVWVAESIVRAIRQAVAGPFDLIVSGGGIHNRTLWQEIRSRLNGTPVDSVDSYGIPADAKEAMAFAYLAWQFVHGRPTNLPGVTGASIAVPLGCWTPAIGLFDEKRGRHG